MYGDWRDDPQAVAAAMVEHVNKILADGEQCKFVSGMWHVSNNAFVHLQRLKEWYAKAKAKEADHD